MTTTIALDAFPATPAAAFSDDPEVKRLRYCHPLWVEYSPRWKFYLDAYQGAEDFAHGGNVFKHPRENQEDFDERRERLDNSNYCEPVVDFFTNFIFSESIDRNGGDEKDFYREFVNDVSLRGETVDDFMRQVSDAAQIFGMVYVQVDTPAPVVNDSDYTVPSKQFAMDNKLRPYWVLIQPEEITDWTTDKFGALTYSKRKEMSCEMVGTERRHYEVYTECYPDHYLISKIDVTDIKEPKRLPSVELVNSAGEVPIRLAKFKKDKKNPELGLSFIRDFAYNNRRILNINSMLDEFLYRQCFNILAIESDGGVPMKDQEDGAVGTANKLEYPKGASAPSYITPAVDPAKVLQDERSRIIQSIFLRASQEMLGDLSNGEKSSGFSQSQSFSKTVPFISARAETLERLETQLMGLTMFLQSKKWNGKIKYKDRYELTDLTSALTQLQMLVKDFQIPSPTFVKAELKRMLHEYDGKLSVEDQGKVDAEIDAMDFNKWQANQLLAFIGAPKTSPTAQQKPKQDTTVTAVEGSGGGTNTKATVSLRD